MGTDCDGPVTSNRLVAPGMDCDSLTDSLAYCENCPGQQQGTGFGVYRLASCWPSDSFAPAQLPVTVPFVAVRGKRTVRGVAVVGTCAVTESSFDFLVGNVYCESHFDGDVEKGSNVHAAVVLGIHDHG